MPAYKRAFSYVRFSDKRQSRGDSLRRQLDWSQTLCVAKDWLLDDSLKMQDLGVSAFRGKNATKGCLSAFLDAIRAGKVKPGDILLVESLDRITREDIDPAWETWRSILKAGVEIYTREPDRHYVPADLNNFGTRVEVQAYFLRAYNESATKSMRGKSYWKNARARMTAENRPVHKVLPAWLKLSADKSKINTIPEAVATVQQIFRWAQEGIGTNPLTAKLNQDKVPTIGRGKMWIRSYVYKILTDPAVMGVYQPHVIDTNGKRVPHGEAQKDYFPQVISEDEWQRTQKALAGRFNGRGPAGVGISNLFTGLIHDARDGYTMHLTYAGSSRKSNTRQLVSYGCRHGLPGSIHIPFAYDAVERAFLATVSELKPADLLTGKVDDREAEMLMLDGRIKEHARKIAEVQERVREQDKIQPLLDLLEQLGTEKQAFQQRLDELKRQTAHHQPSALGDVQTLAALLQQTEGKDRLNLRTRLKGRIQQILADDKPMWMLVWDVTPTIRAAEVQITFHTGKVRGLLLAWLRRGHHRGLITGVGEVIVPEGQQISIPRLNQYRTDADVKAWFTRHHEALAPAIIAAVAAEVQAREVLAQVNKELPAKD